MSAGGSPGEIFIVDDDPSVRDALAHVFTLAGYQVASFSDGVSLLDGARLRAPAVIILDLDMPDPSGLAILKDLRAHAYRGRIFVTSGRCSIPMAVHAIKSGALDFIEKPFDARNVFARVRDMIKASTRAGEPDLMPEILSLQLRGRNRLTPREREVLALTASGASNKEAGRRLGIATRTVEVHRGRIMDKLGARNAADLVRIVLSGGRGDKASAVL
jgi:two-component system response regulator FixJ